MHVRGRLGSVVGWSVVLAFALVTGLVTLGSATAAPVVTPGSYTITMVAGTGAIGANGYELGPACSNGISDDDDLEVDYPADTGCASASDNDEGPATVAYVPPTFKVAVDAAGNISAPASDVFWPTVQVAKFVSDNVGGKSVTGKIDPVTGAVTLTWRFHIEMADPAAAGMVLYIGTPTAPLTANLSTSTAGGAPFDSATLNAVVVDKTIAFPGVLCVGLFCGFVPIADINAGLGLPTTAGQSEFNLTARFDRSPISGGTPPPVVADLTLTKSHTGDFKVGVDGAYSLKVSNVGAAASSGVVTVKDTLPAGMAYKSFAGSGWSCSAAAQVVTCTSSAAIAAGGSAAALSLTVTPSAAGSVTNVASVSGGGQSNTGNDTASDPTSINPATPPSVADLTLTKSHTGDFKVGVDGAYSLKVSNVGAAASSGVVTVKDTLPAGLAYKGFAGAGWSCAAVAQVVTCTSSAAIAAGGSAALSLTVTPSAAGSVTNVASASGGGQSNTGNDTASDPTTVVGDEPPPDEADLTLAKSHDGDFEVDVDGTYSLDVSNVGAAASSGVVTVTDTLPAGLAYKSSAGAGWSCAAVAQVVTCTSSGAVAAGGSAAALSLTVTPSAAGSVTNVASVSGGGQANTLNDGASDPTTVVGGEPPPDEADLTLAKSHDGDFEVDVDGTYSLDVSNVGAAASSGVVTVTDTLPAGLAYKSSAGAGWSCAAVAQVVTCTSSGAVAAGGSAAALSLTVTPSAAGSVTNVASVSGGGQSNTGNDGASDPTTVVGDEPPPDEADLTLAKSHDGDFEVDVDGTYSLDVSNVGAAASSGVVTVTDTLPAGLAYKGFAGSGWSCAAVAQVVTCTSSGSIGAGAAAESLSLTVTPSAAGSVTNVASVSGGGQSNTGNDGASDPTTVVGDEPPPGGADLVLAKSHRGDFKKGWRGLYRLDVSNIGSAASSGDVTVVDTLPEGLAYRWAGGHGWTCAAEEQIVTCTSSEPVAAGGQASPLWIKVKATAVGEVTNTAVVSGGGQSDTTNDEATDPTEIRRRWHHCHHRHWGHGGFRFMHWFGHPDTSSVDWGWA